MKHLVYISGPPCSGKTLLCRHLIRIAPQFCYVMGDYFWMTYEGLEFDERVKQTNKAIINAVQATMDKHVLLEWVPSTGSFTEALQEVCSSTERGLSHIALTVPSHVLKQRKQDRDGDSDIGPVNDKLPALTERDAVIDTDALSPLELKRRCIEMLAGIEIINKSFFH